MVGVCAIKAPVPAQINNNSFFKDRASKAPGLPEQ